MCSLEVYIKSFGGQKGGSLESPRPPLPTGLHTQQLHPEKEVQSSYIIEIIKLELAWRFTHISYTLMYKWIVWPKQLAHITTTTHSHLALHRDQPGEKPPERVIILETIKQTFNEGKTQLNSVHMYKSCWLTEIIMTREYKRHSKVCKKRNG